MTEQQNNGTTLQENVRDFKRENPHTDTLQIGQKEPPDDIGNSSLGLIDLSEADIYADLPPLVTDSLDMDTDNTGYKETGDSDNPNIWIEDSLIHNTELDNFIQAASALAPNDSLDKMERLSQWFQEGCVGETKMPPGIKGIAYLNYILVCSEDLTGRSLSYMDDTIPYKKTEDSSRWYPKVQQESTKPRNSKNLNPNFCSPYKWKSLEETLLHPPTRCHNHIFTFPKE